MTGKGVSFHPSRGGQFSAVVDMNEDTDDIEYAIVPDDQRPAASGRGRALRCARCKQHPVTADRRVCPSCLVELRTVRR